ncbi:MAG: glycosyltransferase family 39 protein, partial [Anaerolineales bacterium]
MNREKYPWLYDVLFLLVFLLAGYLRLAGADWGQGGGQHPDENHFSNVLSAVQARKCADPALPVESCPADQKRWLSLGDYLDSKTSPLNPYNRGGFSYVYGDLPMTIVRIAVDATQPRDIEIFGRQFTLFADAQRNLRLLGRQFSAFADLLAILFLYLIVARLYGRQVGLLAALFSALTVMQIQQSHFWTVDLFVNTFAFLALWFAVAIVESREQRAEDREQGLEDSGQVMETAEAPVPLENDVPPPARQSAIFRSWMTNRFILLSIGFGFALGMAMASKINIGPLAIVLPAAFVLRYFIQRKESGHAPADYRPLTSDYWTFVIICLVAGGLATLISFRIFQPYTFDGLGLDPRWVADFTQQRAQASGEADPPWNLQWARRSHLFSFQNLTLWGLGLPLGILAWAGFLYMGWRIYKGEWRHALLWGWTAIYFLWQSFQYNPTMRYQLPIYPLLAMMAAWVVFKVSGVQVSGVRRYAVGAIGLIVLVLTAIWAFAFHSIYLRDEPRIAASRWIFQNIPGPINVHIQVDDSTYNQPLPFPSDGFVQAGQPYEMSFAAQSDGTLESITLAHAVNRLAPSATLRLTLSEVPNPTPGQILATASLTSDFAVGDDPRGDSYTLTLDKPVPAKKDAQYFLRLEIDSGILEIKGATLANETDFDYPLPINVDGYNAFGGLYRGDLNLQVYWDDNVDKLNRFITTLNDTDYLLIPTNHQYGQITRLPERYPLTTLYYRELIGCPEEKEIIWCYRVAKPGMFEGRLGYDLVSVFETYPQLGPIVINDQAAEEAFTFYDHPKVLIFEKNENFDISEVQSILSTVDLKKVVRLRPRQFDDYSNLLLPAEKLAQQRAGGTWSELFDYDWLQNRYPVLGLLIWYLFIFVLGLAVYPLIRLALPGLADKGYPLSRALGLVLFGYLAWLGGSIGIPYTRLTIALIFGLLLAAGTG